MSDSMPKTRPDRISENIFGRVPESMPDRISVYMSDKMPEENPGRMSGRIQMQWQIECQKKKTVECQHTLMGWQPSSLPSSQRWAEKLGAWVNWPIPSWMNLTELLDAGLDACWKCVHLWRLLYLLRIRRRWRVVHQPAGHGFVYSSSVEIL